MTLDNYPEEYTEEPGRASSLVLDPDGRKVLKYVIIIKTMNNIHG
jgi:hypothetical protein